MENIKTYSVAQDWYDYKLSNQVTRFMRIVLLMSLTVLALIYIAGMLQNQAVKSAQLKNLITYHNENGFQALHK